MNDLEIKTTILHRHGHWYIKTEHWTGEWRRGGGHLMETLTEEIDPTPERLIEIATTLGEDASRRLRRRFREIADAADESLLDAHEKAEEAARSTRERIAERSVFAAAARLIADQFPVLPEHEDVPF